MKKSIEEYVKDHIGNDYIDFSSDENIIEIAADVAEEILEQEHPGMEHWVQDPWGTLRYTETSQDLFNSYYEEVRGSLETDWKP